MIDRNQAIARAWALMNWGVEIEDVAEMGGGYMADIPDFIRHLNEQGFDVVPLVPHEGSIA